MLRPLEKRDYKTVIKIVNESWKRTYSVYINPKLLDENGCKIRAKELIYDFNTKRLSEYVWEEHGEILALLSIGNTEDIDKKVAFEIWRIYVSQNMRCHGIGTQCLIFAENQAKKMGYKEIIIWAFQDNIKAISFYQKNGFLIDNNEHLGIPYLTNGTRLIKVISKNI